jgi:hypothetical protein
MVPAHTNTGVNAVLFPCHLYQLRGLNSPLLGKNSKSNRLLYYAYVFEYIVVTLVSDLVLTDSLRFVATGEPDSEAVGTEATTAGEEAFPLLDGIANDMTELSRKLLLEDTKPDLLRWRDL